MDKPLQERAEDRGESRREPGTDEGRRTGKYPEELDEQLASEFSRLAKDPLACELCQKGYKKTFQKLLPLRY